LTPLLIPGLFLPNLSRRKEGNKLELWRKREKEREREREKF
jgi:hypothetical protein